MKTHSVACIDTAANGAGRPTLIIGAHRSVRRVTALAHRIVAKAEEKTALTARDWCIEMGRPIEDRQGRMCVCVWIELGAVGTGADALATLVESAQAYGVDVRDWCPDCRTAIGPGADHDIDCPRWCAVCERSDESTRERDDHPFGDAMCDGCYEVWVESVEFEEAAL